jgi:hypothetical protein
VSGVRYLGASVPLRLVNSGAVMALPILAASEFDDVAFGGLLVAALLGPSVIAAPIAGLALDRSRRPRRLVLAAAAVTVLAPAVCATIGLVPTAVVVVVLLVAGCATPFYQGGLSSFAADVIPDERRAYAYDALSYSVAAVVGPALVAVTLLAGSERIALVVLAVIAALGVVGVLGIRLPSRPGVDEHPLATVRAGLRHLLLHRPLAAVIVSGTLGNLANGALPIVAVALALQRTGSLDASAWIVTAFAVGALVGAVASAARRWTPLPPIAVMAGGFAIIGILLATAAFDAGIGWTIAVVALSGFVSGPTIAAMLLVRKQQSLTRVRSQVFAIGGGLRTSAAALGAGFAGQLAGLDAGILIALVGGIWVLSAAVLLAYPRGSRPLDA